MTKKQLDNDQCKELCLKLLRVETEKEVEQILKQYKLWDYKDSGKNWRLLGDSPANWSIAGNQQAKPVPSLVEKLINAIDAVLISKCKENGIDPKSNEAPANMFEAVEKFFGVENGLLENESNRAKLAQNIHLICTGLSKHEPCYTVIDKGEGQTPGNIHSTILSLPGIKNPNKKDVPFVQGIFNMGGTGVTRFCGEQSIQLVITKRNPKLLAAGHHRDTLWSFTVLRRRSPTGSRQSSYIEYLAPNNHDTLTFEADTLPLLPKAFDKSAKSNAEHAYTQPLSYGTCIKLYEYKNPGLRSNIQLDLNYELGRHFFRMGLPIRLEERRIKTYAGGPAKGHSFDSTLAGMNIRLQESKFDLIKVELGGELNIENVGPIQVKCYVLQNMVRKNKEGELINTRKNYHHGAEIQVIVNGQQHGLINKSLFCRKTVGLEHLTDDLFIILDATNISIRGKEALFLGSRDRLSEGKEKLALEDALLTWLKDNDTLHILNEEKKRKELEKAIKDTTVSQDVFKNLVKQNPILAEIFPDIGFQIPRNKGFEWKKTKGKYTGKNIPSFFRLEKDEKTFNVVCPMNKSPKIVFEHDALNDYFTRNVKPAKLTISVYDKKKKTYVKKPAMIKSRSTNDGITNVRIQPLSTTKIGDTLAVQIQLIDKKFSVEPIVIKGKIRFVKKLGSKGCQCECHQSGSAKCDKCEDNHKTRKKGVKDKSKDTAREKKEIEAEGGEGQMSLPVIIPVEEGDVNWVNKEFTKQTGIKIVVGSGSFTIYVNMDNESFRRELELNKNDADLISKLYQTAWQFLAVGMYHRMDQQKSKTAVKQSDENEKTIDEKIAEASEGISMVLVSIITKLAPQVKRLELPKNTELE